MSPLIIYGFQHSVSSGYRVADDFVVPARQTWQVEAITFFAYQTGATIPTIDHVNFRVWRGRPGDPGSVVIYGDATTNVLAASVVAGVRRSRDIAPCASDRLIAADICIADHFVLSPGTYWLDWQSGGTQPSGPWAPPITILGQPTTGNGRQYAGPAAGWQDLMDGTYAQGLPFVIEGVSTLNDPPVCHAGGPYAARAGETILFDGRAVTDNSEATSICETGAVILFESLFEPLFADSTGDVGRYGSLAMDEEGFAYVAYYDETHGDLKFASERTRWAPETVDSAGDVGGYTSMVSGLFIPGPYMCRIAYYDFTNRDLKLATQVGASWVIEIIDSTGDVGRGSSVALVSDEYHIVYYDATNGNLKYARQTGTGWVREIVDSDGDVGQFPSIAFSSSGVPYISYYDATNRNLKFATKPGNQWQKSTVDSSGDVGRSSSIALKDEPLPGTPVIAYYDATNGDLKIAIGQPGGQWNMFPLDTQGDVGQYPSLRLDPCPSQECPEPPCYNILYYDATLQDVRRLVMIDDCYRCMCCQGDVLAHVGQVEPQPVSAILPHSRAPVRGSRSSHPIPGRPDHARRARRPRQPHCP